MTIHRIAVLPSGREVEVASFDDDVRPRAKWDESLAEVNKKLARRWNYAHLYRPEAGVRAVFYTANRDGQTVVKKRYRRARRA